MKRSNAPKINQAHRSMVIREQFAANAKAVMVLKDCLYESHRSKALEAKPASSASPKAMSDDMDAAHGGEDSMSSGDFVKIFKQMNFPCKAIIVNVIYGTGFIAYSMVSLFIR